MKTISKNVVVALALIMSSLSYAESNSSVKIRVTSNKALTLIMNSVKENVSVQLIDRAGYILHRENLESVEKYTKHFDASALKDGRYMFRIDYETKTRSIPFIIKNSKILILEGTGTEVFKPTLALKGKIMSVNMFSTENEPLYLSIYSEFNELLYSDKIVGKLHLGKRYDLSKAPRGTYIVELTSGHRQFNHKITVE